MCRWLLYMRDLAGSDDLDADAGISRADAERAAPKRVDCGEPAAKSGLIKYSRGSIQVLDVKGLQKRACECYGTVKAHYQRLFAG